MYHSHVHHHCLWVLTLSDNMNKTKNRTFVKLMEKGGAASLHWLQNGTQVWLLPSDLSTPEIFWFLVSLPSAFGSLPCLAQTCPCNVKSTSCIDLSVSEPGPRPPSRPRILLKAPTLAEMEEMNISEVSWNSVILKGNWKGNSGSFFSVGSVLFLTAAHALFPNLSGLRFLSEEENETVTGKNRFLFCAKTQQLGKFFLSLLLLLLCYIKH